MNNKVRKQIEEYSKSLKWTPENFYWEHTSQVRDFALMIQKEIGGDKDVVEASALLHDIGKAKLLAPGHEEISAQLAKKFLGKIKFDENKISKVIECIRYENFENLEAKILRSADSMSLIMDNSGGREWYFKNVLNNDKKRVLGELRKSFSEIGFDFAKEFVNKDYQKLLRKYC